MDVARGLAHARRKAGLSQRALARASGVPQPAVARWESGRVSPTVDSLAKVLLACGHEIDVRPRRGEGIDRSVIRELLRLTAAERLRRAAVESSNLQGFLRPAE